MNTRLISTHLSQLVVAALSAAAIKQYYSTAAVDDLLWILSPTAFLVEIVTGSRFAFESGAGFMSSDHTFLIAASCSGVNFMIAGFLMLSVQWLWYRREAYPGWMFLPAMFSAAYVVTVLVNTVRIAVAIQLRHFDAEHLGMTADQLHRVEGILLYFGSLLCLFIAASRWLTDSKEETAKYRSRYLLLPLAVYYGAALGVPIARSIYKGSTLSAEFGEHAVFVIVIPALTIGLFVLTRLLVKGWADFRRWRAL